MPQHPKISRGPAGGHSGVHGENGIVGSDLTQNSGDIFGSQRSWPSVFRLARVSRDFPFRAGLFFRQAFRCLSFFLNFSTAAGLRPWSSRRPSARGPTRVRRPRCSARMSTARFLVSMDTTRCKENPCPGEEPVRCSPANKVRFRFREGRSFQLRMDYRIPETPFPGSCRRLGLSDPPARVPELRHARRRNPRPPNIVTASAPLRDPPRVAEVGRDRAGWRAAGERHGVLRFFRRHPGEATSPGQNENADAAARNRILHGNLQETRHLFFGAHQLAVVAASQRQRLRMRFLEKVRADFAGGNLRGDGEDCANVL